MSSATYEVETADRSVRLLPMLRALAWKQLNDLSQSFAVMVLISVCVIVASSYFTFGTREVFGWAVVLPIVLSCGYAFAANFTAFVSERESRTDRCLANLPIQSSWVGAVKVGVNLFAAILFLAAQAFIVAVVLAILASLDDAIDGERILQPLGPGTQQVWSAAFGYALLAIAIVAAGSSIGCCWCSNPWLAILASLVCSILIWACVRCLNIDLMDDQPDATPTELRWLALVGLIASSILAIWGPAIWLRKRSWVTTLINHRPMPLAYAENPRTRMIAAVNRSRGLAMLWQAVRQQAFPVMIALLPIFAMLGYQLFWWTWHTTVYGTGFAFHHYSSGHVASDTANVGFMFLAMFVGLGVGWATLYHDKIQNNFHFFNQHCEYGYLFWLSRVAPPVSLLMAGLSIAYWAWMPNYLDNMLFEVLLVGMSAFSITLLWSMIFRSHVFTLGIAFVGTMMMFWNIVVSSPNGQGSLPMAVTLASTTKWLPLLWLFGSLYYTPRWLSEAAGPRKYICVTLFAITTLATFALPLLELFAWFTRTWLGL